MHGLNLEVRMVMKINNDAVLFTWTRVKVEGKELRSLSACLATVPRSPRGRIAL